MQSLSEFINKTMQQWKVPGLAIAIVKDNEIIFCEGFGKRDVEQDLKVTPKTLFAIASCTKAFTTMTMGILADRGKLDWDKPVRNYLPTFKLYDSYATEHITPRDLVTHRSGLPRHDAMWYKSSFTRQEIFERLQYLEPTHELRTVFQYQNLMYMTAGYLVGQIADSSWEEFVQQEIFNFLEMRDSNFSVVKSQETNDFALPYQEKDDEVKKIPFCNIDVISPAGSINSNVTDMAQWLLLHLNQGKYGEKQIISSTNLSQMHFPQIVISQPLEYNEIFHNFYGLGWQVTAYRGHNFLEHGGNIDGFSALTTFLPQNNIGMVILTNMDKTPLPRIVTYYVCDRLLGLEEVHWNERIKEKVAQTKEAAAKEKEQIASERKTGTQPSHSLKDYIGDFEHPGYGKLSIEFKDNHLTATYNSIVYELEHYHYDIFQLKSEFVDKPQMISFFTDTKGNITNLSVPLEPTFKDIVFTRMPDKGMTQISFLAQFVGEYEFSGKIIKISLKDNRLVASLPGQSDSELVGYRETEFNLKDLPKNTIKFIRDPNGIFTQALITQPNTLITQPNSVFTATKK
ncbi:serine hydrolase [Hassallia byssoidea VB512170]|uniref:Serine hydrolase n=1 Tax=Hassallia byssoidea VB512170 TaxID=1304833 RepID=A0A846H6T5_9CYAN|nr:serine hydrolase [Hassalia byssoidea]NEU72310.1 serine hydrolase [Hassalia byssoidea VB512170]